HGYALAKVELPPATLHPNETLLDVSFQVFSGPQLDIGPITLSGLHDMNEDFVRHRMRLQPGQRFTPEAIEQARSDLAALGVFSVVRAVPADQADAEGRLPLTIDVTERPLHAVDLNAAYSTDLGVNVGAGWHHRNLFGDAEQLNLTGAVQLGGTAVRKPGYVFGAQFIKPDFLALDQSLEIDLGAVKQSLDAYDQNALTQKIAINRKLSTHWLVGAGLTGEEERIRQEGVSSRYNLIGLPVTAKYDDTNNLFDPTTGMRAAFTVTPMQSLTGQTATFLILQASGSTYFDLAGNGRSVLALRALVGQELGVGSAFSLPPDQRFYAGGSGTVRGYRYQSIGPQFPDDRPTGGTAVSAGSVEFRQRILDKYGVVAFVDAGQV
ncbi:MAG: autotransporter assembly complex family protein, partial [Nevskiales bacterium]